MGTISLKNINKSFGSTEVLKQLSLDIQDGEFLTLVGPSGCGKSTLLKIIAGLEQQNSGDVIIDDKNVNSTRASKRDLAMVFQSYALYPHLTVRKNLETPLKLRDYSFVERLPLIGNFVPSRKEKKKSIDELVFKTSETLKITELLDRKPGQLSGGQRVAFLMDEPLSNLDAALRVHMRSELSELHNSLKTTFIYVTHDQAEALTMSTRMAVMIDGELLQLDTPSEVYNNPSSLRVAEFVGSPKINTFAAQISSDGSVEFMGIKLERKFNTNSQKALVAVRPEHLEITKDSNKPAFEATVSYRENLGSDIFYHVQVDQSDSKVIVRGSPAELISNGETVRISPSHAEAMLFETSGERIQ